MLDKGTVKGNSVSTQLKCSINSICHQSWEKKVFERTGRLDDMSAEVTVCVPTAAAPFFHRSLLTPINVLHMTGLQQQGLIAQGVVFILHLLKYVLSAVILTEFHINCFVLVTSLANLKCPL